MLGRAVAFAAAAAACLASLAARAQDAEGEAAGTAEEMIDVERETWRSPGLRRRCPEPKADEIVVCADDPEKYRVESPTDEAIRKGEAVRDGTLRAPYVLGLPECGVEVVCHRVGRAPEPPLLIDLAALPHALTPEEAALVFRAEDRPAETATPEAASPAEAP